MKTDKFNLHIPFIVLRENGVKNSTSYLVYGLLKMFCYKNKDTYVSYDTLAKYLDCNPRSVERCVKELISCNCVKFNIREKVRFIEPLIDNKSSTSCKVKESSDIIVSYDPDVSYITHERIFYDHHNEDYILANNNECYYICIMSVARYIDDYARYEYGSFKVRDLLLSFNNDHLNSLIDRIIDYLEYDEVKFVLDKSCTFNCGFEVL